ncbi:uncharacterized protein LOC123398610 [Hordeum vulgare subsp. vulgare]|uniref:Predicted protein n=1 Tax=Hordeum vulgare subsp. vulgare TaxID=112509 RepID=F2ELN6_HORVV|nr:uncharacterized protein LOC123398610 [Hordeum vulgare subsp. vulgare]BAK08258.1 predicted protein [Hordeum vulgare subsp. vulgare]
MAGKNKGKTKTKKAPPSSTSLPPPPPVEPQATEAAATSIDVLTELDISNILRRLSLADLLRAALACHRWRRLAARCLPRAPPLLGYFHHPTHPPPPFPGRDTKLLDTPALFAPLDAASPRLTLDFAPDAFRFLLFDSLQGLLLFESSDEIPKDKGAIPRFLVLDPSNRRRTVLPPPRRETVRDDRRWRKSRYYIGSALLSRAHPSKLCFEAVCFAIEEGRPRAWVASVTNGDCSWRALPRDEEANVDFNPWLFENRGVRACGKIYWHICNSPRMLVLDPATLRFSYLQGPRALTIDPLTVCKFRVGETPDGRLCLVTDGEEQLQLWVRGMGRWSDNGWLMEKSVAELSTLCDMIPGMPSETDDMIPGTRKPTDIDMVPGMPCERTVCVWPSDMDTARTGKVFIKTWGFGRYSYDICTGKLERLATKRGKEYGHPMFAYFLAWPPAFLAPEH